MGISVVSKWVLGSVDTYEDSGPEGRMDGVHDEVGSDGDSSRALAPAVRVRKI